MSNTELTVQTFKNCEEYVARQRINVRRARHCVNFMRFVGVVIILAAISLYIPDYYFIYKCAECGVTAFIGLTLVFSAVQIKRSINDADLVNADGSIVIMHSINFGISSLIWSADAYLTYEKYWENSELKFYMTIVRTLLTVCDTYMDIFVLILLDQFAKVSNSAEKEDAILGKKVPNLVYIANQRLLAETIQNEVNMTEEQRKATLLQAQVHEHMYELMRK